MQSSRRLSISAVPVCIGSKEGVSLKPTKALLKIASENPQAVAKALTS